MAAVAVTPTGSMLAQRIGDNLPHLPAAFEEFLEVIPDTSAWLQREWQLYSDNPAHILLTGAKLSLLEAATSWAVGTNRGAAASLRAAVENAFAWLFYKDHPVEFRVVQARRAELYLPKAVQTYLSNVDGGFSFSYSMLSKVKKRPNDYYYSDLSQWVHAQPGTGQIEDIAAAAISSPRNPAFLSVCRWVDEFVSDNYLAAYRNSWGDFPEAIQVSATARLGKDLGKFVAVI